MKDEIKEIRDYIACPQLGDDYYGEWGALRLDQRIKIKQLLDYITKLQEEIERLKELNVCVGCNNNPDYKSRCEKAIEVCNRYLSLNLQQFKTRTLLNLIVEILKSKGGE